MNDHVYLNGKLVEKGKATVSVLDRGLLYGDGVFETMRAYAGRVFAFDRHARRLFAALETLGFSIPETEQDLAGAVHELLLKNKTRDTVVRLTVTRGVADGSADRPADAPTRIIHCRPLHLPDYENGVTAVLSEKIVGKTPFLSGLKSLNYLDNLIARKEALDKGAYEALIANSEGQIVEGSMSNVFAVFEGKIVTPPLGSGALPGVTRGICLDLLKSEALPVREADIPRETLASAEEVFLTNSVMEIVAVVQIGDRFVGDGNPGPVSRLLRKRYLELVEKDLFSTVGEQVP